MKKVLLATALILSALVTLSAQQKGDWLVRARLLGVLPQVEDDLGKAGEVQINDAWVPELDFTYFFTDHLAAELILGTARHNVNVDDFLGNDGMKVELGDVQVLPPTLTLQYHFAPNHVVNPYLGAGINYTLFFDDTDDTNAAVKSVDYDSSFGFAAQGGLNIRLCEKLHLNLDVKKVWMKSDVTVKTKLTGLETIKTEAKINPWLVGLGLGITL